MFSANSVITVNFGPIALFASRLTEVFAYSLARVAVGRKSGEPGVSNFKISEQSPLNYLLISQIGSNFLQKSANLAGFSAGETTLTQRGG